jgi:hypothetical protein
MDSEKERIQDDTINRFKDAIKKSKQQFQLTKLNNNH